MRQFGLIGYPLTHSFSKKYFEEKFQRENISDCSYDLFPLSSIDYFPALIQSNPDLVGLNVTIPYKESVMSFLNKMDETAKHIGAVNCIKISNGRLSGFNTDVYGFEKSLGSFIAERPEQTFVLGTGGSAKAISYVLSKLRGPFIKISRKPKNDCITYDEIPSFMKSSNLFINCTPLGMFLQTDSAPEIPYSKLTEKDFLFDLVYNPEETLFLKKGKQRGVKTKNGLEMLHLQAEKSWEIWSR